MNQLPNRGLAHFDFVITGLLNMPADANDASSGIIRRAQLCKLRPTHRYDVFYRTKGFDVVNDGRAHIQPKHRGEIRRLDSRISSLALQRFDQPRLLAADVGTGATM